jgi:hypothetical protein
MVVATAEPWRNLSIASFVLEEGSHGSSVSPTPLLLDHFFSSGNKESYCGLLAPLLRVAIGALFFFEIALVLKYAAHRGLSGLEHETPGSGAAHQHCHQSSGRCENNYSVYNTHTQDCLSSTDCHVRYLLQRFTTVLLTVEGLRPRLPSTCICYFGLADVRVVDFPSGLSSAVLGGLCTNETETPCDWVSETPIDKKLEYLTL